MGRRSGGGLTEWKGGRMMRRDGCLAFERMWGSKVYTIEDLEEIVEGGG